MQHTGYAICEHAGAVVPVDSWYARKADAAARIAGAVAEAYGLEVTAVELFPASCEEQVREMVEGAAADSDGWVVLPALDLVPGSAAQAAREYRDHCNRPLDVRGLDAGQAIAALAAAGVPARYSKGGNVWAWSSSDLEPAGMRWSKKRGLWWIEPAGAGCAVPESCRLSDFEAEAATAAAA